MDVSNGYEDVMRQIRDGSMGLAIWGMMFAVLVMGCMQESSTYRSDGRSAVDQRPGGNAAKALPPIPPAPATGNRPPGPE
jgi:hypothetical protein